MSGLESRARWLLHAYPQSYRTDRGEEIIGTLLEAGRPGQSWPATRETWSLLTGGLRARAARNQQGALATYLRLAVLLAAALWLAASPALDLALWTRGNGAPLPGAVYAAWGLLLSATIAAPWVARRGITVSLALTAAIALGLWGHVEPHYPFGVALFVVPPLALAAAVATEPTRPPLCWLWIPASAFAASTLFFTRHVLVEVFPLRALMEGSPRASWLAVPAYTVIAYGLVCAVVPWLAVDARPFTAVVIVLDWFIVPAFVSPPPEPGRLVIAALLLVPIGLAGLAISFLRRKVPRTTTPGL